MPSIVSGFDYDIFISYRHNDNLDGWVTDFVQNLDKELKGTLKESLSIYFDRNPEDGLLETHSVDKTLEGKLKCLIFIPILSQTYCDPKSFAWQHEFCSFNTLSRADGIGTDIRLGNGNIASRILPVKIHDLDPADKVLVEKETGGALRAIDFIFRSAGVNRPLHPHEEHANDNQNKTYYRDQINKVANAVKNLVQGIQSSSLPTAARPPQSPATRTGPRKVAYAAGIALVLSLGTYFLLPDWLAARSIDSPSEAAIAVLYFDNMSGDASQEYLSDGLTEEIITRLTKIIGLRVVSRTSVRQYKGQSINIKDIAGELNVPVILEGSVRKSGNQLRVVAQLINAETDQHMWAETFDRELDDVFAVQTEIAQAIAEKFRIHLTPEQNIKVAETSTRNTIAYDYYLKARHIAFHEYYFIGDSSAFERSKLFYEKAIAEDPRFALPLAGIADLLDAKRALSAGTLPEELDSLRYALSRKAFALDPNSAFVNNVVIWMLFNRKEPLFDSALFHARRAIEVEPNDYYNHDSMGYICQAMGLPELAIPFYERAAELNPIEPTERAQLGSCYLRTGQLAKSEKEFQTAYDLAPSSQYAEAIETMKWLIETGREDEAEKMVSDIMRKHPTQKHTYIRAYIAIKRGRYEEAIKIFPGAERQVEMLCEMGRYDDAFKRAKEIAEKWDFYLYLQTNPVLKPLQTQKGYKELLESQRERHEAALKKYGPLTKVSLN